MNSAWLDYIHRHWHTVLHLFFTCLISTEIWKILDIIYCWLIWYYMYALYAVCSMQYACFPCPEEVLISDRCLRKSIHASLIWSPVTSYHFDILVCSRATHSVRNQLLFFSPYAAAFASTLFLGTHCVLLLFLCVFPLLLNFHCAQKDRRSCVSVFLFSCNERLVFLLGQDWGACVSESTFSAREM